MLILLPVCIQTYKHPVVNKRVFQSATKESNLSLKVCGVMVVVGACVERKGLKGKH